MYIKKIRLIDYKRFHNLTIDLGDDNKRIVALVGPNGCGKTTILNIVTFIITGSVYKLYDYKFDEITHFFMILWCYFAVFRENVDMMCSI